MVLDGYYGASEDESAVKTLCHAIDRGMMIDSADAYGNGHNEALLAIMIDADEEFYRRDAFVTIEMFAPYWRQSGIIESHPDFRQEVERILGESKTD